MARKGPSDSTDDDKRIWARVTGTVTPPARRKAARVTPGAVLPDPESPPVVARPARVELLGLAGDLPGGLAVRWTVDLGVRIRL